MRIQVREGTVLIGFVAHYGIRFAETRNECFANIVNGAILGPGRGYDGIEILGKIKERAIEESSQRTFGFGGAGFGLQANLTTLLKLDIKLK